MIPLPDCRISPTTSYKAGPDAVTQTNLERGLADNTGVWKQADGSSLLTTADHFIVMTKHPSNDTSRCEAIRVPTMVIGFTGQSDADNNLACQNESLSYSNGKQANAPNVDCISNRRISHKLTISSPRQNGEKMATETGNSSTSIVTIEKLLKTNIFNNWRH